MRWVEDFFRRAFGRTSPAPRDERGWSEDWQVGDRAQCILDNWLSSHPENPRRGQVLIVSALHEGLANDGSNILMSSLLFEGKPQNRAWRERYFRKIRPAEESFTEQMRRLHREGLLS